MSMQQSLTKNDQIETWLTKHFEQKGESDLEYIRSQNRKLSVAFIYDNPIWHPYGPIEGDLKTVFEKICEYSETIKSKDAAQMKHFERLLSDDLSRFPSTETEAWVRKAFDQLVSKVGELPSWQSVTNIKICVDLIKSVSKVYKPHLNTEKLFFEMQQYLENFLNDSFTEFIFEMGGWNDFLDYYEVISKNQRSRNSSHSVKCRTIAMIGLGIIMITILRRITNWQFSWL